MKILPVLALLIMFSACGVARNGMPAGQPSPGGRNPLVRHSGTEDARTETFTLIRPCGKFVIDWTAEATGRAPVISFRVFAISMPAYAVEFRGPYALEARAGGEAYFPLPQGSYTIQVESSNVRWSLEGRCEI